MNIETSFHPAFDPKFKALIPPLHADELQQLEANLILEGCRDPLVVWAEKGVVLDGHNRLEICKRLEIPYQVKRTSFDTREAAETWIINNQLGRRNLHPDQISVLRGKRYNLEKLTFAEAGARKAESLDQFDLGSTADRLASEYKVSPATIKRDGKFAEAVDALEEAGIDAHEVVAIVPKSTVIDVAGKLIEGELSAGEAKQAVSHNHRAQGTGENEWYTPPDYLEAARSVLGGFDLDPATSPLANATVGALHTYTKEDNGLSREWAGRVWMNPPYSQPDISLFSEKLASEWEAGRLSSAIALTHNYTDTAWFHRLAGACNAICFTRGRIGFLSPSGVKAAPTQGQAFFYFGSDVKGFSERFSKIGFVVEVV